MDQLKAMQVFVTVARKEGFAPAAESLGLSTSSVSRHVGNLEAMLGVQLLRRTTRHVSLTSAGEDVLDHCEAIVGRVEQMLLEREAERGTPSGRLRVTIPNFLIPILMRTVMAEFIKAHPMVELEITITDRLMNLVDEGIDLALRVGKLTDSNLMVRKFIDLDLGVIGSPDYLERYGVPQRPADLAEHNCIIDTAAPYRERWPLLGIDGTTTAVAVHGNITVNGGAPARDLVVAGVGLAYLPEYLYYDDVEEGRVVTVLDDYARDYGGIYIVHPATRHQVAAIKSLTDLLVDHARPLKRYREAHRRALVGKATKNT
ncbi:MAG: LysR family transcriptional regulator [Devosia sp.]